MIGHCHQSAYREEVVDIDREFMEENDYSCERYSAEKFSTKMPVTEEWLEEEAPTRH